MSTAPQPAPDAAPRAFTRARAAVIRHFPPGQFARYLVVGLVNTAFGYSSFAILNRILAPHIAYAYIFVGPLANIINITFSLLTYKKFIFKTKGNYTREWLRCAAVSASGIVLGTVALPTLVVSIRYLTPAQEAAPYIGWAILLAASVVMSFIGHRKFTFAQAAPFPTRDFDEDK